MKVKGRDLVATGKVKAPALSNEVKRKNLIRDKDKLFDLSNPFNRDWCIRHGINPDDLSVKVEGTKKPKKQTSVKVDKPELKVIASGKSKTQSSSREYSESEINTFTELTGLAQKMMNLTLFDLVMRYGGPMQLKGWVDILDKLMSAQKKDVDIQEKRKDLVPRQFVDFLKGYVNTYNNQLLDFAEGCTTEIISLVASDKKKAKIEIPEMLRRNFSKLAEETVKRIDKEVKNLKVQNDESDNQ